MTTKIRHGARGFHLTFANGYALSVQYGLGNYCSRRSYSEFTEPSNPHDIESTDFEMALFDPQEDFVDLVDDPVHGWIPFGHLGEIIALCQDARLDDLRELLRSL